MADYHLLLFRAVSCLEQYIVVRGSCRIRTNWHLHETTQTLPLLHHNKVDENNGDDNDGNYDHGDDNDDQD